MTGKNCILQIIGCLMKTPQFLSQSDKYNFTLDDFETRFEKILYVAIDGLYVSGATVIHPIDVENFISTSEINKLIFEREKGIEYLMDAEALSDINTFDYYYTKLKKINLLKTYQKSGIDISDFYNENLTSDLAVQTNEKFEQLTIQEIINDVHKKIFSIEKAFVSNDISETRSVSEGIEKLIENFSDGTEIGVSIQGHIVNEIISGARLGTLVIRSGSSGVSKTRQAVGDACYLAFPLRYNPSTTNWETQGHNEKVLFIATEQDFSEIQKMILAYLTGMNEDRFKYGQFSEREQKVIAQATDIIRKYEDNFYIVRMPNPTIELVKTTVRESCLTKEIKYLFYDYIFIGPSLLNEFRGFNLRNDKILSYI